MSNSIGNLKNSGLQGNNFPWQLKMLMGQQCACDQLTAIAANTDDVEFLLTSILNTLQASTEYEAKFVVDTCDSDKVYLEVRVWDTATSTWGPISYYVPGSDAPVTPVGAATPGCLQYADPGSVLGLILAELQSQTTVLTNIEEDTTSIDVTLTNILAAYSAGQQACGSSLSITLCTEQEAELFNQGDTLDAIQTELLDQGTTLDTISTNVVDIETLITTLNSIVSTEVTLQAVLTELQGLTLDTTGLSEEATQLLVLAALNTIITNTTGLSTEVTLDALLTAFTSTDFATETTLSALSTWIQTNAATEATLLAVDAKLTPVVRTPTLLRATGSGTIAVSIYDFSVLNSGLANGTILGQTIRPGESLNFSAGGLNNTYSAGTISYDGTGTELLIIYNS